MRERPLEISVLNLRPGGLSEGREKLTLISLKVNLSLGFESIYHSREHY